MKDTYMEKYICFAVDRSCLGAVGILEPTLEGGEGVFQMSMRIGQSRKRKLYLELYEGPQYCMLTEP